MTSQPLFLVPSFSFRRRQSKSRSRRLLRRLITLIFAGRNRIIVIRRELPRTSVAGSVCNLPHSGRRGFSVPCAFRPLPTLPPRKFFLQSQLCLRRAPFRPFLLGLCFHPDSPDKTQ